MQVLCGILAARLAAWFTARRGLAIAAGVAVAACPPIVWGAGSGMEVGLASALALSGFLLYLSAASSPRRQLGAVSVFAVACLARPEMLVIFGIVSAHSVLRTRPLGQMSVRAVQVCLIAIVFLGPFVWFDYATTGRPLPTTFYAKSGPGIVQAVAAHNRESVERLFLVSGPNAVRQFADTLVDQLGTAGFLALAGFPIAAVPRLRQRGALLVAISVAASVFAMGLAAPQRLKPSNFRYTVEFVVLAITLGVSSLTAIWPLIRPRPIGALLLALLVAVIGIRSIENAPMYAASVRNINQLQVALGRWMKQRLPTGSRVAVNDIGAVAVLQRP